LFDSTLINEPLEITYGVPNQVIKGLEIVLNKMKEKDQAVLIFPSVFGFGEQGSSTGIVPPYTSLKYKIHIINVKDPEEL
jgi:FKBP-type peptidyl-prolyl cis-trans isomerase